MRIGTPLPLVDTTPPPVSVVYHPGGSDWEPNSGASSSLNSISCVPLGKLSWPPCPAPWRGLVSEQCPSHSSEDELPAICAGLLDS